MDFINILAKIDSKKETYLSYYEIKYDGVIIANSKIYTKNNENNEKFANNIYELDIDIYNMKDEYHYKEIAQQTLLKYINTINTSKFKNPILIIYLLPTSFNRIFSLISLHFKLQNKQSYSNQSDQSDITLVRLIYDYASIKQLISNTKLNINISQLSNQYPIKIESGYDKSYIISSAKIEGLLYIPLQIALNSYGLHEISSNEATPFLLWLEMLENYKFDPQYYYTKCYVMNMLAEDKSIITNKNNLYFNFKKYCSEKYMKYFADTWSLNQFANDKSLVAKVIKNNEIFIVRPAGIGAFSGKDIYIVKDKQTLEIAIKNTKKYQTVLISKYITNPLLFNGKKFHVRIYFLVGIIKGYFVTNVFEFYKILTAKLPYINSDYGNKNIHDTHFDSTDKDYIFPLDITDSNLYNDFTYKYMPQIRVCLQLISKFIKGKISMYKQTKHAFEIFGCDFMIRDDKTICLLEINDKVGYKCKTIPMTEKLSQMYFNVILTNIIKPLLLNTNIATDDDNTGWLFCEKL